MESINRCRILHTMLRIRDINRSVKFYTEMLGMKVLRTLEQSEENYTLIFLGYTNEAKSTVLELTYNHGVTDYDIGNAYGHIAIGVTDIQQSVASIKKCGGIFTLEPTPLSGSDETIAFLTDPDGYQVELIERTEYWL